MKLFKSLAINILLILLVLYILSWLGALVLSAYTRHGESLTLPNLKGLNFEEVEKILEQKKLRYIITDTAFIDDMPKGSVVEQNPAPNTKVKEGRFIYITINSTSTIGVQFRIKTWKRNLQTRCGCRSCFRPIIPQSKHST